MTDQVPPLQDALERIVSPRAKTEEVGTWCIWTKSGRRPSFFHPTEALAMAEAERLAKLLRDEPVSTRLLALWLAAWACPALVIAALAWCAWVVTP